MFLILIGGEHQAVSEVDFKHHLSENSGCLVGAKVKNETISNIHLSSGMWFDCDFEGVTLKQVSFADDFMFKKVIFNDCELEGVGLHQCAINESKFIDSRLCRVSMRKAKNCELLDVELVDCNLRDANFSNSQLLGLKLIRTPLEGINLTDGKITGNLNYADLRGADLTRAVIGGRMPNGKQSNAYGIDLSNARITKGTQLNFGSEDYDRYAPVLTGTSLERGATTKRARR